MNDRTEFYIYGIVPYDKVNGNYSLILKEKEGSERMVALIIGSPEAQSIAIFLEGPELERPLTHDLVCNLLLERSLDIDYIIIDDTNETTYYASIVFSDGFTLDARPSDAISIAIRIGAPILIMNDIVERMHFDYTGIKGVEEAQKEPEKKKRGRKKKETQQQEEFDMSSLQKELDDAIEKEDYERAANLRDLINKIN